MTNGPNMTEDHHMMNGEQAAILMELCEQTGHPFDDQMTSDSADDLINRLSDELGARSQTGGRP